MRILPRSIAFALCVACTQTPPLVTQPPVTEPPIPTPPEPAAGGTSFGPTELPSEALGLYGEAAAFAPLQPGSGAASITLDIPELVAAHPAPTALLIPFDADRFYEPARVNVEGTQVRGDLPLDKPVLVVLELGTVASDNYRLLNQLASYREQLSQPLGDDVCKQVLCSNDVFKADQLATRVPGLGPLQTRLGLNFPAVDVGLVEPQPTACDGCLARWPSALPCLLTRCKEFPLPRKARVRKNIAALSVEEVASLRAGVAAMKARPDSDPRSWVYQAKMHAVDSGDVAALQDGCQHRQFYFFPWHRMYVAYFERILRAASGDPNLTLPYWNYSDVAAQRAVPVVYRDPANTSNSLYDSTRAPIYNAGAQLPAADVSYTSAFSALAFTAVGPGVTFGGGTVASPQHFPSPGASGLLERSPHNNVHNDVNGNMATGESPRDPIFWLHHSNIDRLWNKWIEQGGARTNPTADPNWMNQTFTFFDETGAQVSLTGATILNTVDQLGYRYDDDPYAIAPFWPADTLGQVMGQRIPPAQQVPTTDTVLEQKAEVRLTEKSKTVALKLQQANRKAMQKSIDTKLANEKYFLELRGVRFDAPVGVTYLLFLNLPAGAKNPDHTHPNFLGTLGFFGHHAAAASGHHESGAGATEAYDITELVKRLGKLTDLKLTLVPSYPELPPDRKDLVELRKAMKPAGEPRIAEIAIIRQPTP